MYEVVLGIDSGTQSTKVLAVDVGTGDIVGEGRAPHSGTNTQHPNEWWEALQFAVAGATTDEMHVSGLSVAAQQHGCVLLDAQEDVIRPASLWNNVEAAPDAERLNDEADFAAAIGSRLVASFTIAKLAHLARTDPAVLARTAAVGLPHDWLNFRLTGYLATDRGDASGSGWWSPAAGIVRRDLLVLAVGEADAERLRLPDVLAPNERAGRLTARAAAELCLPEGVLVGPGTGDNMAAALGAGALLGELVISLGTSGTAFAVSAHPTADSSGEVCGFADATGKFLPLACMLNCTRVLDTVAKMLRIPRNEALERAATMPPGAHGVILLPYFEGERTPNLPDATGTIVGLRTATATPDHLLRAALDGVAAGLAYCVDALERLGVAAPSVTLTGGGAGHPAWQQAIADATGRPVLVRKGGEHAARGAAIQAAALVRGQPVEEIVRAWRPELIAETAPRPGARAAFALGERRRLVQERYPSSTRSA